MALNALTSSTTNAIQYAADPSRNIAHTTKRCPGFLSSRFTIQQAKYATATLRKKFRKTAAKCKQTSGVIDKMDPAYGFSALALLFGCGNCGSWPLILQVRSLLPGLLPTGSPAVLPASRQNSAPARSPPRAVPPIRGSRPAQTQIPGRRWYGGPDLFLP